MSSFFNNTLSDEDFSALTDFSSSGSTNNNCGSPNGKTATANSFALHDIQSLPELFASFATDPTEAVFSAPPCQSFGNPIDYRFHASDASTLGFGMPRNDHPQCTCPVDCDAFDAAFPQSFGMAAGAFREAGLRSQKNRILNPSLQILTRDALLFRGSGNFFPDACVESPCTPMLESNFGERLSSRRSSTMSVSTIGSSLSPCGTAPLTPTEYCSVSPTVLWEGLAAFNSSTYAEAEAPLSESDGLEFMTQLTETITQTQRSSSCTTASETSASDSSLVVNVDPAMFAPPSEESSAFAGSPYTSEASSAASSPCPSTPQLSDTAEPESPLQSPLMDISNVKIEVMPSPVREAKTVERRSGGPTAGSRSGTERLRSAAGPNAARRRVPRKMFPCPWQNCNRVFPRQYNLTSHMFCHTGERPHSCELCQAMFARKHDLRRHMRTIHSESRPFRCGQCHHSFSQEDHYRRHLAQEGHDF
ncbi:hypothetical protein DFJ73DRAFT_5363 [Zopfochytrium polystomum]|nr:hypothetical protein DFJ73DRAFT_5363 [Zopfochytrium polystomum]